MSAFSHVSSHSTYTYFGDNHYTFFKNRRGLGGVFSFILMGTFSTLALLLLQHVCSHFKLFLPLSALLLYSFLVFSDIHLPAFSAPTFNFMFSYQNVQLLQLFQPPSAFLPFQPFNIFIFLPFQLLQTFHFIISYENVKLFKLF